MRRRLLLWVLALALCAPPGLLFRAPARAEAADAVTLFLNSREALRLSEGGQYRFTPPHDGSYLFWAMPGTGDAASVSAELTDEAGRTVARGEAAGEVSLRVPLTEGVPYTLTMPPAGTDDDVTLTVEVMEDAYGRCIDQPTRLNDPARYTKAIVEPRDTHWYLFEPERSGWYTVRSVTGAGAPDTRAVLLDADRRELAQNDDVMFPGAADFRLFVWMNAHERYYLRVCADSNQTGSYQLLISAPQDARRLPSALSVSPERVTLKPGETAALTAALRPAEAAHPVTWASDRPDVCAVDQDGALTAVSAGTAVIHAFSAGLEAAAEVTVTPIALTGLSFDPARVEVAEGSRTLLQPVFAPENASDRTLTYASADPSVATVDDGGTVTGVRVGETTVTARSAQGVTAEARVAVTARRPVYRALVLGEQNYEDGRVRLGGLNTAQGVFDMLANQRVNGTGYQVTMRVDSTRAELVEALGEVFAGAVEGDVSLLYVNAHGDYDGTAWIELHDGARVTAEQLYALLRDIPGRVVLIVDCCRSGSFLGRDEAADRFTQAVISAFAGGARTPFQTRKFVVLTSAGADEDSYRRSFLDGADEAGMATIMARSLCEGAGWDLIDDRVCTLKADLNRDRAVTVQEIYQYTRKRVMYYLSGSGVRQSVRVWPEGDQTALFGRADTSPVP